LKKLSRRYYVARYRELLSLTLEQREELMRWGNRAACLPEMFFDRG